VGSHRKRLTLVGKEQLFAFATVAQSADEAPVEELVAWYRDNLAVVLKHAGAVGQRLTHAVRAVVDELACSLTFHRLAGRVQIAAAIVQAQHVRLDAQSRHVLLAAQQPAWVLGEDVAPLEGVRHEGAVAGSLPEL
jgi:hypothetical protein